MFLSKALIGLNKLTFVSQKGGFFYSFLKVVGWFCGGPRDKDVLCRPLVPRLENLGQAALSIR